MAESKELNSRQRAFVEAYTGNATQAAIAAGYSPKWAGTNAQKLLKNTSVREALTNRERARFNDLVASREERQAFWSTTMRDRDVDMNARLKASELLGKSECDFAERVEVSGEMDIGVLFDPEKRRRVLERIKG